MPKENGHLPLFGPGPLYVGVIVAFTVSALALSRLGAIPRITAEAAALPLRMVGMALVALGVALWVSAVFLARIDDGIKVNRLVTDGVYSVVRNPIYSAFALVCTGAVLVHGNLWLLVPPPLFWAFLTVLMRATEERWLLELHGPEYEEYCRRVNRCIPWFPRR